MLRRGETGKDQYNAVSGVEANVNIHRVNSIEVYKHVIARDISTPTRV